MSNSRKLIVEVVGDSSGLERAFRRSSTASKGFGRDLESASRGALAATLSFRGLGRALTFASAPFLASGGIVFGLKSTIDQAVESQRVLAQTANAVKRAGLSWRTYGEQVQRAALAQANLSGFDDERLLGTFSQFVRRTKDVNAALRLNALAANVARGRNIELEQAANLVLKASLGQAGALRRLGIDAKNGASAIRLITLLQQKYANSASAFGRGAAGAQARFNVALGNTQELIGGALLPTLTQYLNRAADWLSETKNQEQLQRTVTAAVAGTSEVLKTASSAVKQVTDAFGGVRNTLEALVALKVASVASGWATSFVDVAARAGSAAAALKVLRARALALTSIGLITIAVELAFTDNMDSFKDKIDKKLQGLKKSIHDKLGPFGFLTNDPIRGNQTFSGRPLEAIQPNGPSGAEQFADAAREHRDQTQRALDKAIAERQGEASDTGKAAKKLLGVSDKIALAIQQARLAISRGDTGGDQQLVGALRQQVALNRRNQQIQERLIRNGVGDLKQHVKTLNDLRADEAAALNEIAAIQKERADTAKQSAQDATQNLQDMLQLRLDDARLTRGVGDDLRQLGALEALLLKRIKAEGRTADLLRQLGDVRRQRRSTRQFAALGLDASGGEFAPAIGALRKSLARVSDAVAGSFLDTKKTRSVLGNIRKVLSGQLGALTVEVRGKVKELLDGIDQELDSRARRNQTRFRHASLAGILGGLGLDRRTSQVLSQRIAQLGPGGTVPGRLSTAFALAQPERPQELVVNLDGHEIARVVTPHQRKQSTRRTTSRRGPYAGHH